MVESTYSRLWRQKLGGGCLSTILIFIVIYFVLGQCNHPVVHHAGLQQKSILKSQSRITENKTNAIIKRFMNTNPKLLIVDDEEELSELMHIILKDEEYKIECAYTLEEGNIKWQSELPPIVLLDNYLPDGFGIDLIERDRSLLDNCKVIMVTADELPETRRRAKSWVFIILFKTLFIKTDQGINTAGISVRG